MSLTYTVFFGDNLVTRVFFDKTEMLGFIKTLDIKFFTMGIDSRNNIHLVNHNFKLPNEKIISDIADCVGFNTKTIEAMLRN